MAELKVQKVSVWKDQLVSEGDWDKVKEVQGMIKGLVSFWEDIRDIVTEVIDEE